jgi:hypothetical protein
MATEQKFIPILRGTGFDKLMWVMAIFNLFEVRYRMVRHSIAGPIMTVREDHFMRCWEMLNKAVGQFAVDTLTVETAAIDLPDNHPFFKTHIDTDALLAQAIELYDEEMDSKRPKPEIDPADTAPEIELPDEGEINEINVIPIKKGDKVEVKVTPTDEGDTIKSLQETVAVEEDDEDDDDSGWLSDGEDEGEDEWDTDDEDETPEIEENPMAKYANMEEGTAHTFANELLQSKQMAYPKVKTPVQMYDIDSSNLGQIGFKLTKDDPNIVTFYVAFKSGMTYRYNPVALGKAQSILGEAVKRQIGFQEASAGVAFHALIKEAAEAGDIKCQRLDAENERWVEVLPKAERKALLKEKNG